MKRVRIMLMAVCLVAVAGGVLAFKAITPADYCTANAITTQVGGPFVCANALGVAITCPNYDPNKIYTTTTATTNVFCTVLAPNTDCTRPNGLKTLCAAVATATTETP